MLTVFVRTFVAQCHRSADDVVTLTDPVVQLFRLSRPQSGQIEIRIPRERQGLIGVTSSIGTPGRSAAFTIPVAYRGDGARAGNDHVILGVTSDASTTTALTLAETTGIDATRPIGAKSLRGSMPSLV